MSEVLRFKTWVPQEIGGSMIEDAVRASDFDRITAERDAALGREARAKEGLAEHWKVVCDQRVKIDALQQRLTAADDQIDALATNLRLAEEGRQVFADESDQLEQRHRAEFEAGQAAERRVEVLEGLLREVVALDPRGEFLGWQLDGEIDAALNPATEGALKPAEGGGDDKRKADFIRLNSAPHCPECGHPDCNGQCFGDDMMGSSS